NAVQHGISSIEEGGLVEISASRKGEFLELQVHDTGRRQGEARPAHCGVGLPNVNARLEQHYGSDFRLDVGEQKEGGFLARILLPFRNSITGAVANALPAEIPRK